LEEEVTVEDIGRRNDGVEENCRDEVATPSYNQKREVMAVLRNVTLRSVTCIEERHFRPPKFAVYYKREKDM
jgi:hypothetical protein